jgi:hypothetical protein
MNQHGADKELEKEPERERLNAQNSAYEATVQRKRNTAQ